MASKRAVRRRACGEKQRFATREEAIRAARALRRDKGGRIREYPCQFCGGYHIGHYNYEEKERV